MAYQNNVRLLLFCFVFWNIYFTNGQENYINLRKLFNALKEHGLQEKPQGQPRAQQYTCTTVLAEEEINNISWLKGNKFPKTFTEDSRRVRVQYNEENNAVHGEKIVLNKYLDGLIEEMKKDRETSKYRTYPIVLMYSHYIPCSMKDHICAKLLADHRKKSKYRLHIGFSEFFLYGKHHGQNYKKLTRQNIEKSFETLQEGQINVYYMIRDFGRDLSTLVLKTGLSDIFQENLYDCLIKQPLAYCCSYNMDTDIDQPIPKDVVRIVSFSINSIVYQCREQVSRTRRVVKAFTKCIDKEIEKDTRIGPDCRVCASGRVGREIFISHAKQCVKQTSEFSTYIGATSIRLDQPSWQNTIIYWKDPAGFNDKPRCYDRKLRPDSFCTLHDRDPISRKRDRYDFSLPENQKKNTFNLLGG